MESLGRYRLLGRLGSGGFSTVWLGFDDDLDIHVAIKVLADNWVGRGDISQRFLEEARLLRRVADTRVVRVHDIGWQSERPYFVMDYVSGGTLAELDLPLPAAKALALASEIARAVQVIHDHEVIHRDVKPSNVLLTGGPDARVVIADLGMAKRLAESSGVTMAVGTPSFMAPEQAHGQTGLDVRVDVYAVAAVGYLLLTGHRPFPESQTPVDVAMRSPTAAPGSLAGQLREADATLDVVALDELLRVALAYDPARRPATAAALADQLDALAETSVSPQLTQPAETRPLPAARLSTSPLPTTAPAASPLTTTAPAASPLPTTPLPASPLPTTAPAANPLPATPSGARPLPASPLPATPSAAAPPIPARPRRSSVVALAGIVLVVVAAFTWIGLSLALA